MLCFPKCPDRSRGQAVLYYVLREFLLQKAKRPVYEPKYFYSFSAQVNIVCVELYLHDLTYLNNMEAN